MTVQEPPEGWSWGIGGVNSKYSDRWAYHTHHELYLSPDDSGKYRIEVFEYSSVPDEEDRRLSEYPVTHTSCETQEEAEKKAVELMEQYS